MKRQLIFTNDNENYTKKHNKGWFKPALIVLQCINN